MSVRLKRVYDEPSNEDGTRILVDRLWPRGLTKQRAQIDVWLKDIAPSAALRAWFGHDPAKFGEFKLRYLQELGANQAIAQLRDLLGTPATLVYDARDTRHNHALVIKEFLDNQA